jgi:dihydrolipoamide dehydrogenase
MTNPSTPHHAQLAVIGSGPGGYTAAFRAADLGLQVTLIERYPALGGVCLNVGCIPSKALLHVADVVDETQSLAAHGVTFGSPQVDLPKLDGWKQKVVGTMNRGLTQLAKRRKVTVLQGEATFVGPHQLSVTAGDQRQTVTFDQAIVAAGSRVVRLPDLPWEDSRLWDSTAALKLDQVPGRLLVVGGGIIGLEMATVYRALGSQVSVVELTDRLIPEADDDLVAPLRTAMSRNGTTFWLETKLENVISRDDALEVQLQGHDAPKQASFDAVLVAVGRRPNGDQLSAEAAGFTVDERGFIPVDSQQRTNVEHIFAIGDIVGQPMLAHKASHQGKVAAEVAAGHRAGFDVRAIPGVAYTNPEVAWVGLTERRAKTEGRAVEVGRFPWAASGRAVSLGRQEGLTKLLFDGETRKLLGGGVVGPQAGELIGEIVLALEMNADWDDIALTVHAHPTLSETVGLAAEAVNGTITDLYLPKRK